MILEAGLAAIAKCSLKSGTIVTENQRDRMVFDKHRIEVVPFWEWCMSLPRQ